MTEISTLPTNTAPQPTDVIPALRSGQMVGLTVSALDGAATAAVTLPPNALLGRPANMTGSGAAQAITPAAGLALQGSQLAATATDHLALAGLSAVDLNMELIVNSAGTPMRIPFAVVLAYLVANNQQSLGAALATLLASLPTSPGPTVGLWNNGGQFAYS